LHQIALALPHSEMNTNVKPKEVSTAQICWPLGLAENRTASGQCHVKRSAWILRDTIPPTLPDRLSSKGLIENIWFDPVLGLRTSPSCNAKAQIKEVARWPSLLETWLTVHQKQEFGLLSWSPDCLQMNIIGNIKLMGIRSGSRLRATPGKKLLVVNVDAVGGTGLHYWLLDGKQVGLATPRKNKIFQLNTAGKHSVAVIDAAGHFDSIEFLVDGL
jgi:penicillin-binding protein 1C